MSSVNDLCGGYLNTSASYLYQRYGLISSRDHEAFYIVLGEEYQKLCDAMNKLQEVAFEINSAVLNFYNENYELLVKEGLLMPRFLASLNICDAINQLRTCYLEDDALMKVCSFQDLLKEFLSRAQRARYEVFIMKLASAYSGYRFYLPAFLDLRGRINRSGVLHFHERDLARSLIVFSTIPSSESSNSNMEEDPDKNLQILCAAAAFHYKKFISYEDASEWYSEHHELFQSSDESLIKFAVDASHPCQFISKILCLRGGGTNALSIPITQDASASAYQIMAYFLLDIEIAKKTNLIPSLTPEKKIYINDIYTFFLEELQDYLRPKLDGNVSDLICSRLTRKLVKKLFMPLIYGKTIISMSNDINSHYSTLLNHRECALLASLISEFFTTRFPGIVNLMELVRNVSWLTSAIGGPVSYDTPLLTTVQDYMKSEIVNLWVYDRIHKKRRQVTLRIPTKDRDRRKTYTATFANFIHQKDANIAVFMIMEIFFGDYFKPNASSIRPNVPIYSVHDNFITTAPFVKVISNSYIKVFAEGRHPLQYINYFMIYNLGQPGKFPSTYLPFLRDPYFSITPLPNEYIQDILDNIVKKNLTKNQKKVWDNKILNVMTAYTNYVNRFCDKRGRNIYHIKWYSFQLELSNWYKLPYNYSLHL